VRDLLYGSRLEVTAVRAAADPLVGGASGRRLGRRYSLLERLAVGSTAGVYRARDEKLGRPVAVKVIAEHLARDPLAVRRFRREAECAAQLTHPNIVAILDAGDAPREFIVMELVEGGDASALLRARRQPTAHQAIRIVTHVCDALDYAHGRGVLHQDVSPRNILVRRVDGIAKLADFGLASSQAGAPAKRGTGIPGTPGYVAPEVLGGEQPSVRSDLYSLGTVAHRLLAGPAASRELSCSLMSGVTEAVERAIADDPAARQSSVAEFRSQLHARDAWDAQAA
jgi:serine/threonine-protein kinase